MGQVLSSPQVREQRGHETGVVIVPKPWDKKGMRQVLSSPQVIEQRGHETGVVKSPSHRTKSA